MSEEAIGYYGTIHLCPLTPQQFDELKAIEFESIFDYTEIVEEVTHKTVCEGFFIDFFGESLDLPKMLSMLMEIDKYVEDGTWHYIKDGKTQRYEYVNSEWRLTNGC